MPRAFRHSPARRRPNDRGLTLLEMGIALAIVLVMAFVAVPTIEAIGGVRAREESGRLAGAIRYMYGQSALSGKVCRMVFDMDEQAWWTECTEGRFTVELEKERSRDGRRIEDPVKQAKKEIEPKDEIEAMRQQVEKKAEFSQFKNDEMTRRKLPNGARLAVWTGHQREKYTKGRAFLYFFPQGNTERAQIYVSSEHGDFYTLVVSPLSGRVKIEDKERDVPRD